MMIKTGYFSILKDLRILKNSLCCVFIDFSKLKEGGNIMTKFEFEVEHKGQISDGYHTFDELYNHRMILFSVICNLNKDMSWKSKLHADGTMYDNYFIVGITTENGDYTYHYHIDHWHYFDVNEIAHAPEWDGHKPEDITRLFTLVS